MWESGDKRQNNICKYYKDSEVGYEFRWQNPDIFAPNQWSETVQTWSNTGTLIPHVNASYDYKSLIDADGLGIICPYNELWIALYWFALGVDTNQVAWGFDFKFRPREINKSDLLVTLIQQQCNRPCGQSTLDNWPCLTGCILGPKLEEAKNSNGKVLLPNGKEVDYKDYFKDIVERKEELPCLKICKSSFSPEQDEVIKVIDNYISFWKRLNINVQGYEQILKLLNSEKEVILRIFNETSADLGFKEVMQHFYDQNTRLDQFRQRKINHFYSILSYAMWEVRSKKCTISNDNSFFTNENILDKFPIVFHHYISHVEYECPNFLKEHEQSDMPEPTQPRPTKCSGEAKNAEPDQPDRPSSPSKPEGEEEETEDGFMDTCSQPTK